MINTRHRKIRRNRLSSNLSRMINRRRNRGRALIRRTVVTIRRPILMEFQNAFNRDR
jgi:hypothetical protein